MAVLTPLLIAVLLMFGFMVSACSYNADSFGTDNAADNREYIQLPPPVTEGVMSLEESIYKRVSRRSFSGKELSLEQAGQILWAAQGLNVDSLTGASRTAPSAGATYPMEIYLVAGNIKGLPAGLYHYQYMVHSLELVTAEDYRGDLAAAALDQSYIADAPASIVLAAVYDRTTSRYGERGLRYVHMEAGHITQNILLQCESLNLGAVAVGAFNDQQVRALLNLDEEPLMIVPFGQISSRQQ